jgi:dipeptide/tripeptide permease
MIKSILGVIVGFVVMWLFSFAIFSCAYLALGAERVFEGGSYDISAIWMVCMIALGLIGGIVGGLVCAAISKRKGACMAFAGILLVLGLVGAIMTKMKEHPDTSRSGDVPMLEAMQKAQTPPWLCFVNPFVVVGGVLLGARMKKLPAA